MRNLDTRYPCATRSFRYIDKIILEWAYRVSDGTPDAHNSAHQLILRESLEEFGGEISDINESLERKNYYNNELENSTKFSDDELGLKIFWLIITTLMVGFLIYGPDSLVSATAAVDFGTRKGASTASGIINGLGSIGAIAGGTIPGFFKDTWGWDGIFIFMAGSVFMAGSLMITKWNALPNDSGGEIKK